MQKIASLLIILSAIQAHAQTYQKKVIPQAASPAQVEAIIGASIRTEKIWGTGLFEGTLIGEKWNFHNRTREGYQISWAEFEVRLDSKHERVFRSSDIQYEPETLTQRKGLMERFSSGDVSIEAASLTMSYYSGQRSFPFYAVRFSHSNKTKEQIREVTFYVELLEDFDAPVDSNAAYTQSTSYTPDMRFNSFIGLRVQPDENGTGRVPKYLRISAYDHKRNKLTVSGGVFEISPPR